MIKGRLLCNGEFSPIVRSTIDQAKRTLCVRAFLMDVRHGQDKKEVGSLLRALGRAQQRGVSVRVILTATQNMGIRVANLTSAGLLAAQDVEVRFESSEEHGKYIIIDDATVIVGSHNWTSAAFGANIETSVALDGPEEVHSIQEDFDGRWERADTTLVDQAFPEMDRLLARSSERRLVGSDESRPSAAFNLDPVDAAEILFDGETYVSALLERVSSAKASIRVMMFRFSARTGRRDITDTILHALVDAKSRGVAVQVLLDHDRPGDALISGEVNEKAALSLARSGVEVRKDSIKKLLHSKVVLIDSRALLVGSHNWTRQSLLALGEVAVMIEGRAVADSADAEFQRRWASSTPLKI